MRKYVLAASALLLSVLLCGCNEKTSESKQETQATQATTVATTATTTAPPPVETQPLPASSATFYTLKPYQQRGTGPVNKNENEASYYYTKYVRSSDDTNHISTLKDKTLEAKVNQWIDTTYAEMEQDFKQEQKNHANWSEKPDSYLQTQCYNGYLCLQWSMDCTIENASENESERETFSSCCVYFDLYTGKQLALSDLFYEGVDFIPYFNNIVARESALPICTDGFSTMLLPQKREFCGLTEDCCHISFNLIMFPHDNPYFSFGTSFYYNMEDSFIKENAVFWKPRNMAGIFTEGAAEKEASSEQGNNFTYRQQGAVGNIILDQVLCDSKVFDAVKVKQIAALTKELAASADTAKLLKDNLGRGTDEPMFNEYGAFAGYLLYTNILTDQNLICISIENESMGDYGGGLSFCYDIDTLEPVSLKQIIELFFGADWAKKCKVTPYSDMSELSAKVLADHMDALQLSNVWMESIIVQYGKNEFGPLYYCISKE